MGLMNDIPAEFAANLQEGITLKIRLDEEVDLEISLDEVVVCINAEREPLDPEAVRILLYGLVTRDLIHRNKAQEAAEGAKDPQELVKALVVAYDSYNVSLLRDVWSKLVDNVGRAVATTMINDKLGKRQAHDVFRVIKGEG